MSSTLKYLSKFGSRIHTILNGVKRPVNIAAKELNICEKKLEKCIKGKISESETQNIAFKIAQTYPVKLSDIYLDPPTDIDGIIYCSKKKTDDSARIIKRLDHTKKTSNFYEYFDCAMDKFSPFKPELIKMLRDVDNNNPYNEDVAYNKGHLETQFTFYIGEVNFYYDINGIKYCYETNTGDSNIIIPYIPHTFTNRNKTINSKILAITFSNTIASNLSNLSHISDKNLSSISGDLRNNSELFKIRLDRYLDANFTDLNQLEKKLEKKFSKKEISEYFHENTNDEITFTICDILNINYHDLIFNPLTPDKEVIFKKFDNIYSKFDNLLINKLAISEHIKNTNHFNIKLSDNNNINSKGILSSYYQFIYNYSDNDFDFYWGENLEHQQTMNNGDSLIINPFTKHLFEYSNDEANFYLAKIPGILNESILNEYAQFDLRGRYRVCDNEKSKWW